MTVHLHRTTGRQTTRPARFIEILGALPAEPVRRPFARFTGSLLLRCPCGGTIAVADAADPLVCPECRRRWRVRAELIQETPAPETDGETGGTEDDPA